MSKHPSQGTYKKVLCVCTGGLLRSPTAAWVLSNPPFNYNTRCAGLTSKYALIQVDEFLLNWADEIVCMEKKHEKRIKELLKEEKKVICLHLNDEFVYRDPELIKIIAERYHRARKI